MSTPSPRMVRLFERLGQLDDPSVDAAMAAALPTALPDDAALIVPALLSRQQDQALTELVCQWHRLPANLQQQVLDRWRELYAALRLAAGLRHTDGPANAMEIIRRTGDAKLAYLVVDELRGTNHATRPLAAQCLLDLVVQPSHHAVAQGTPGTAGAPGAGVAKPRDEQSTAMLIEAVLEAVKSFHFHQQAAVLRAMCSLSLSLPPASIAQLGQRSHPALPTLRDMLDAAAHPQVRHALLLLIRLPVLTHAAAAGLARCVRLQHLGDVLDAAHLLHHDGIARQIAHESESTSLIPRPDAIANMTMAQRRALPAWVAALQDHAGERLAVLATLLTQPDPLTRLATLRVLMAMPSDPVIHELIARCSGDSDPAIARIALRHLILIRWSKLTSTLVKLVNSPDPAIQRIASDHLAPMGFLRFWNAWPKLSPQQQLIGAKALIKLDGNFPRLLGERLAQPERPSRLRALAIIQALNHVEFFEAPLIELLKSPDEVVVSSVVKTLGMLNTPASIAAVEKCLEHSDARVRANAIESLQQLHATSHIARLVDMARMDENRPRANAIQALMAIRAGDALGALSSMLHDSRPAQRISALWLVDHMGLIDVSRTVAEMAVTDPSPDARARAEQVVRHLIDLLRAATPRPLEPALSTAD